MKKLIILFAIAISLISCEEEEVVVTPAEQLEIDLKIIDDFLLENNITAQTDPSGLRYVINDLGDGATPNSSSVVAVKYEGRLMSNGSVFDSFDEPEGIEFPLNRLILGWQIGIPLIEEGGSITLYIPSGLAYGPSGTGSGSIPGNAVLIFDIELVGVK